MRRPSGFRGKSNHARIPYVCVPVMVPLVLSVMLLMLLCTQTALVDILGSLLGLFQAEAGVHVRHQTQLIVRRR